MYKSEFDAITMKKKNANNTLADLNKMEFATQKALLARKN